MQTKRESKWIRTVVVHVLINFENRDSSFLLTQRAEGEAETVSNHGNNHADPRHFEA
jgi:hypothetical protein